MYKGFVKIAAAVPRVFVADCRQNVAMAQSLMARADGMGVEIICFPELSLTGYTCGDLFHQQLLLEDAETALLKLMEFSHALNTIAIVGVPLQHEGLLYDCAVVIKKGKILGIVPKKHLASLKEQQEKRWFSIIGEKEVGTYTFCGQNIPFSTNFVFKTSHYNFSVAIGNDFYEKPTNGADIIFNPCAHQDLVGKSCNLHRQILAESRKRTCACVMASCGYGESTQDMVFSGNALIAEYGKILAKGKRFTMDEQLVVSEIDVSAIRADRCRNEVSTSTDSGAFVVDVDDMDVEIQENFTLTRAITPLPFVPKGEDLHERCEEVLSIQSEGLARRIEHTHAKHVVIGVSGGLDSTLALLVAVNAFDRLGLSRKGIVGVTMPGFGTTDRTYNNALELMEGLGITIREISIKEACLQHFSDIYHDVNLHDVTYENAQARERTQVLMDIANQLEGFVVGTGDLSELALGWATYNGDHMSMYGVNASVPKTLIKHLVAWVAKNLADEESSKILLDIIDTPISPELKPADEEGKISQKTEDLVGPYELHDFFLYHTLRYGFSPAKIFYLAQKAFASGDERVKNYSDDVIKHWITIFFKRFFAQQFKRSCLPDGPQVGSLSLSPRGAWMMPSDAISKLWVEECENLY